MATVNVSVLDKRIYDPSRGHPLSPNDSWDGQINLYINNLLSGPKFIEINVKMFWPYTLSSAWAFLNSSSHWFLKDDHYIWDKNDSKTINGDRISWLNILVQLSNSRGESQQQQVPVGKPQQGPHLKSCPSQRPQLIVSAAQQVSRTKLLSRVSSVALLMTTDSRRHCLGRTAVVWARESIPVNLVDSRD